MIDSLSVLVLITARKNSKRLPNKNTLTLCGKPLIEWTFSVATNTKYVDEVILSSDNAELKKLAQKYNVKQPFIRPANLSNDDSKTEDVMEHAIRWLEQKQGKKFDIVVLLQPTSPFRSSHHLEQALEQFVATPSAESLVSVSEVSHSEWLYALDSNNYIENESIQSCFSKKLVIPNGAIYIVKAPLFLRNKQRYTSKTLAYVMNRKYSVDIDTADDLELASKWCELLKEDK